MKGTIWLAARPRVFGGVMLALFLLLANAASADTEIWDFDLETSGEDVFWTSPTAACNVAPLYDAAYEVTLVEVTVSYLGIPFGPFDITDQIPPEQRSGSGTFAGPPPFVVMDEHIRFPAPPEPVTFEADVLIEVDGDGYGQGSITNVTLGTMVYDLGPPWGEVEVQIETVRVAGTVWVTPVIPGDLDGDDDVDLTDLAILLGSYGIENPWEDADIDGDGDVDLSDLAILLSNYGLSC
jgi:hypothetical protein